MDYQSEIKRIGALAATVRAGARRLSWNLARTVPDAIARTADSRHQRMCADSEPYRRNRADHPKVIAEIIAEETAARHLAAGTAQFAVEPTLRELDQAYREMVAASRRDTALSMPGALDRLDPAGMISYHLLMETLRPTIATAPAADLLRRYGHAMETKDAHSLIVATLVEERAEYGGLAATETDLGVVRQLTDYIEAVRDLRVPYSPAETGEIEDTIVLGRKSISMADLVKVRPIDASHPANANAKAAFDAETDAYARAEAEAAALAAAGK